MNTFAVIAYLMIAGQTHSFVADHGLTQEDCQAALTEIQFVTVADGIEVPVNGQVTLICEIE